VTSRSSVKSGYTMIMKSYFRSHWCYDDKYCRSFCNVKSALFLTVGEARIEGPHAK
jgi:hypothetical protein